MAGQQYWEAIVRKERRRADDNLKLAAQRAGEIDKLRVQLTALQARSLALVDHLVTYDTYTRDMAIIQDVLVLIPGNAKVK